MRTLEDARKWLMEGDYTSWETTNIEDEEPVKVMFVSGEDAIYGIPEIDWEEEIVELDEDMVLTLQDYQELKACCFWVVYVLSPGEVCGRCTGQLYDSQEEAEREAKRCRKMLRRQATANK